MSRLAVSRGGVVWAALGVSFLGGAALQRRELDPGDFGDRAGSSFVARDVAYSRFGGSPDRVGCGVGVAPAPVAHSLAGDGGLVGVAL